jgi:hypothetical protein
MNPSEIRQFIDRYYRLNSTKNERYNMFFSEENISKILRSIDIGDINELIRSMMFAYDGYTSITSISQLNQITLLNLSQKILSHETKTSYLTNLRENDDSTFLHLDQLNMPIITSTRRNSLMYPKHDVQIKKFDFELERKL